MMRAARVLSTPGRPNHKRPFRERGISWLTVSLRPPIPAANAASRHDGSRRRPATPTSVGNPAKTPGDPPGGKVIGCVLIAALQIPFHKAKSLGIKGYAAYTLARRRNSRRGTPARAAFLSAPSLSVVTSRGTSERGSKLPNQTNGSCERSRSTKMPVALYRWAALSTTGIVIPLMIAYPTFNASRGQNTSKNTEANGSELSRLRIEGETPTMFPQGAES